MKSGDLAIQGDLALTRNVKSWLRPRTFINAERTLLPAAQE